MTSVEHSATNKNQKPGLENHILLKEKNWNPDSFNIRDRSITRK